MKIRWTSGSIRIRVTPSELESMRRNEIVREEVRFGSGSWSARIVPGCALTDYKLMDGGLVVNLSLQDCDRLADPAAEGVYFDPTEIRSVRLYIEKDFVCEHPRPAEAEESETETFPRSTE